MSGWQIAMLVAVILVVDLAVIGAVFSMCGASLKPLVDAFPPVTPAVDAVRRKRQSFRFDSVKFGGCIHVAADAHDLHLQPVWLARRFGMKDISVPWSAFGPVRVNGKWAEAQLRSVSVRGPAWCMSLASPAPAGER